MNNTTPRHGVDVPPTWKRFQWPVLALPFFAGLQHQCAPLPLEARGVCVSSAVESERSMSYHISVFSVSLSWIVPSLLLVLVYCVSYTVACPCSSDHGIFIRSSLRRTSK